MKAPQNYLMPGKKHLAAGNNICSSDGRQPQVMQWLYRIRTTLQGLPVVTQVPGGTATFS